MFSHSPLLSLRLPPLVVVLCCVGVLARAPIALAQPAEASASTGHSAMARGQLVFGLLGQPLHASPNGPVTGPVKGAPALLLEEGLAASDGRRWVRVLTADLSRGWLPLAASAPRAPVELRSAVSGAPCASGDAACLERAVEAEDASLSWEPVAALPEGRECAWHQAFGMEGLVRGPFLRRPAWAGLTALVRVPSSAPSVAEPLAAVRLSNGRLTLVSEACRQQEFGVPQDGLVDLTDFQCISPERCQHALLVEAQHRSGQGSGSTLYLVSGQTFQLPQVRALELNDTGAQAAHASWWVEHAPRGEGGTLWIVRAMKTKSPSVGVEQVTVGPVPAHPEHPAHPTPRAFQALLLEEGPTRESLAATVSPLEACLGQPVPRFELPRNGRWVWAAGRLFETTQQAAAWKATVHRCGMKQGFTLASLPNASFP